MCHFNVNFVYKKAHLLQWANLGVCMSARGLTPSVWAYYSPNLDLATSIKS